MKIGIYGGTFDPPHLGHMQAAKGAMEQLGLDRLLFMPAALPPHKALPMSGAVPRRRYEMVCLMADGMQLGDRVEVSRLELDREGKNYTADTLKALRQIYPNDELWLLLGSDMFLTLQTWHKPEEVFAQASVAGFSRSAAESVDILALQADYLKKTFDANTRILRLPVLEVSSTKLRILLSSGSDAALDMLWPPVYGYILRHHLYGSHENLALLSLEELRVVSDSMVQYRRVPHIRGTETEAARLARRWGANEENAARAAILHDCTKYESGESQRALCAKYNIALDDVERQTDKLLHAKTAAAIARVEFGMNAEVCAAILTHTTGRPNMSLLQKILYVADYIEPTRDFPEVQHLRDLANEDLDRALEACLELNIHTLSEQGAVVHRDTAEALAFLKEAAHG